MVRRCMRMNRDTFIVYTFFFICNVNFTIHFVYSNFNYQKKKKIDRTYRYTAVAKCTL